MHPVIAMPRIKKVIQYTEWNIIALREPINRFRNLLNDLLHKNWIRAVKVFVQNISTENIFAVIDLLRLLRAGPGCGNQPR